MALTIPVVGTGYYPTSAQAADRYFAIIHRRFNPFIIDATFRKQPTFLYLVLRDIAERYEGGFNPINQNVYFTDWGAVVNKLQFTAEFTPSPVNMPAVVAQWNIAGLLVSIDTLFTEWSIIQGAGSSMAQVDAIKTRFTDFYFALVDYIDSKVMARALASDEFNGLQDAVDDGTTVATYGGLSRTDYPNWAAVKYANTDTSTDAWKLVILYLHKYANTIGRIPFNLILCSYGVFNKVVMSMTSIERSIIVTPQEIDLTRGIGVQSLNINGINVIANPKITDATVYFLNFRDFKFMYNPDAFFSLLGPESLLPVNVAGWRAAITFAGQLYCVNPRQQMKVTDFQSTSL
jgi:hypothetical protein